MSPDAILDSRSSICFSFFLTARIRFNTSPSPALLTSAGESGLELFVSFTGCLVSFVLTEGTDSSCFCCSELREICSKLPVTSSISNANSVVFLSFFFCFFRAFFFCALVKALSSLSSSGETCTLQLSSTNCAPTCDRQGVVSLCASAIKRVSKRNMFRVYVFFYQFRGVS